MKNIDFSKLMQPQNEPAKIEEIPDDEDALESEKMFRDIISKEGLENKESLDDAKIREISSWVSKYSKEIAEKGKITREIPRSSENKSNDQVRNL